MSNDMNKENIPIYKIILIGRENVGKTSIINRFVNNEYTQYLRSTISGKNLQKQIQINDKEIILELWDTAGSEKYRALTKLLYNNTSAVIFVYDITEEKSFEELKNFWYKEIEKNVDPDTSKIFI